MLIRKQVAFKRFIDDVAVEVIETCLVSTIADVLSPISVTTMDEDLVKKIAGESEETRAQRDELQKQVDVLTKGFTTCKHFVGEASYGKFLFALYIIEIAYIILRCWTR